MKNTTKKMPVRASCLSAFFVVLFLCGCDPGKSRTLIDTIDAGSVITADIIPTSFNESIKCKIATDKGVFLLIGMPSVMIGEPGHINIYDDARRYICFDSWESCRRLYN